MWIHVRSPTSALNSLHLNIFHLKIIKKYALLEANKSVLRRYEEGTVKENNLRKKNMKREITKMYIVQVHLKNIQKFEQGIP